MCFTQKGSPQDFLLERHGPLRKNKTSYCLLAQFNVPNIYQVPTVCSAGQGLENLGAYSAGLTTLQGHHLLKHFPIPQI